MTDAALVCANHPGRETSLRCNRCGKPICGQCAVRTPVGYRCKECVAGQQKIFDTARWIDYPLAGIVTALGVGLALLLLGFIGFWGLFLAPVVGGGLAEIVRWAVRRRRSRRLPWVALAGGLLGMLPHVVPTLGFALLALFGGADFGVVGGAAFGALWPVINGGLVISTLFYRLRGIAF